MVLVATEDDLVEVWNDLERLARDEQDRDGNLEQQLGVISNS